jgi:hypothetical protein
MPNIASNETSSFDLTGTWKKRNVLPLTFRFNRDEARDVVITYEFDRYDLIFLRDVLNEFLDSEPKE